MAGLNYNINMNCTVYGGVFKSGNDFTKKSSYWVEAGVSYHPSCKIFWVLLIKLNMFKFNI